MRKEYLKKYGQSKNKNFRIIDNIPTCGHGYTIGPAHVNYAAEKANGFLDGDTIRQGEKEGKLRCAQRGCPLSYDEHTSAALVECDIDINKNKNKEGKKELQEFLTSINEEVKKEGLVGYAFILKK